MSRTRRLCDLGWRTLSLASPAGRRRFYRSCEATLRRSHLRGRWSRYRRLGLDHGEIRSTINSARMTTRARSRYSVTKDPLQIGIATAVVLRLEHDVEIGFCK